MFYTDPSELSAVFLGVQMTKWFMLVHVGFMVGAWIALTRARRYRVNDNRFALLLLSIYAGALIGGRLFSVFFDGNWQYYTSHWREALVFWRGGYVFYGGLIGGVVAAAVAARLLRLSLAAMRRRQPSRSDWRSVASAAS